MSLQRMAFKPFLLSALWTTISASHTLALERAANKNTNNAATFTLSSEIAAFVPSCASSCFRSFLEANFPVGSCGSTPSLRCLCPRVGANGFTVGEGAVSCIIVENDLGVCSGMDASSTIVSKAYGMCGGQPSAAIATHSTIVASQVVPPGVVAGVQPTAPPSTLLTASRPPTPTGAATFPSVPVTTFTETPGPAASSQAGGAAPNQKLSAAQIAGISIGAAGAILIMVAILMFARCCRRSKDNPNGFARMRDSLSFGHKTNWSPNMLQISGPVTLQRPEMDFKRAMQNHQEASFRPETIGLAISPDGAAAVSSPQNRQLGLASAVATQQHQPQQQRSDTPPKPALTLSIPGGDRALPLPPQAMPFAGRDSVVTEFAEDGEDGAGGAQIWRPPPSAGPMSATTFYVADKWGNWVLGNPERRSQAAELEGSSPGNGLEAQKYSRDESTRAVGPSLMPSRPQRAQLGPPIQFKQQTPLTRSSSVYSNFSLPQTAIPGPDNPMPRTLPPADSYQRLLQENAAGKLRRKSSKGLDRSDSKMSERSATTIASSTDGNDNDYETIRPDEQANNLSPVVESPQSVGVSPVTYPRIRGRTPDRLKLFPAPVRGDLHQPPGQPSPTLGLVTLAQAGGVPQRKPVPTQRNWAPIEPGHVRTGSANMPSQPQYQPQRGPSPGQGQRQQQSQFQPRPQFQQQPQYQQQPQHLQQPHYQQQSQYQPSRGPSPGTGPRPQQPQYAQQQQPRPWVAPPEASPGLVPAGLNLPQHHAEAAHARSSTPTSFNSTSSSLLAKRLGADRAAALTRLGNDPRPQAGKWKRHSNRAGAEPAAPGFVVGEFARAPLPASPAWVPRLTPTRKGDNLYLNVQ